jgi:hypothetical protein
MREVILFSDLNDTETLSIKYFFFPMLAPIGDEKKL